MMPFQPDYHHMLHVLANKRPLRLPLYEHLINPEFMEILLNLKFTEMLKGNTADLKEFFVHYCRFYNEMTYDTVSFETCITDILPDNGAIMGGKPGPIQNRNDFEKYPWVELPHRFWEVATPRFDALRQCLPKGMKAVGGVGNGVFEISEDLVGFEYLAYMMADDPDLFSDLYRRIGDLLCEIWKEFLRQYSDVFIICRFGDDLGFKNSTLVAPDTIYKHIIPQYKRIITQIRNAGRPFLWHSCGKIFEIMENMISIGIDAKHSNEDVIAPFEEWITLYSDRIGLLGGIDVDLLCMETAATIFKTVIEKGQKFRKQANGYALGSGNSIPEYVPVEGYLAMVRAAHHIRENEKGVSGQ
jgi:uroporphyrinogen decarboxylase